MKEERFDLVVVGAGVFGLSTCVYLSMHYPKLRFALIEQFKIGHGEGSSHSDIRIIRSTYFQEVYMKLCIEALQRNWPQVEKLLGEKFIADNPFISFTQTEEDFKSLEQVSKKSKGQIQLISIEQAKKRFPSIPNLKTNYPIFLDKKAGIVYAAKYIKAMTQYLRTYSNITIFEQTQVLELKNNAEVVHIVAKKGQTIIKIQTNKVALSCGRWIGKLVPKMKQIVSQVRQTIAYLQMKQPENYTIGKYPSWVHYRKDKKQYFNLPNVFNLGIKFIMHNQDPTFISKFKNDEAYIKHCLDDLLEKNQIYFDGKIQKLKKYEKCYYTVTKNEDFVIDWTDNHQNVLIVSPCSGHGFKFGPIIGDIIADLLVKKKSFDLFEQFRHEFKVGTHLKVLQKQQLRSKL